MVNPIFQQDEELLLNPFGSKYLSSGTYTDVNSSEFVVQEDAVISVLTGGDASIAENSIDYKASMNLSGVTLKKGALIVAPVGEAFKSITIDSGSIMAYNCVVKGDKPGSFVGLLDDYPDAAAAYSLRKLRTDYEGAAIEVRRSSDNAVQDIGFVANELDTDSLLSFAEGGDVSVAKWYDQSGGAGNDVVQVSESAQPKIVSLGNLVEENGKPSIYFDGNVELVSLNNTNYGTSSRSLFLSSKLDGDINGIVSLTDVDTGVGSVWIITSELAIRTRVYIWVSSTELPSTNLGLVSNIYTSGQLFAGNSVWLNGNDVVRTSGTDGAINTSIGKLTVGSNGFGFNAKAFISEFIVYQSDQSANRTDIETNINDYYTIY